MTNCFERTVKSILHPMDNYFKMGKKAGKLGKSVALGQLWFDHDMKVVEGKIGVKGREMSAFESASKGPSSAGISIA